MQTETSNLMTCKPETGGRGTIGVWTARLAGLAIACVALAPAWLAYQRYQSNQAFLARAVRVEATVADFEMHGSADDRKYVPVYRFQDAGGYELSVRSKVSYRNPPAAVGQVVPLLYDPDNPEIFKQPSFVSFWAYICVLLAFSGVLVLFAAIVFARGHRFIRQRH